MPEKVGYIIMGQLSLYEQVSLASNLKRNEREVEWGAKQEAHERDTELFVRRTRAQDEAQKFIEKRESFDKGLTVLDLLCST